MMRKKMFMALVALGIMPLAAQEVGGASVAGSVAYGFDSTKSFTGKSLGFALDGAYDLAGDIPVRFGVGVSRFGAGDRDYAVINGDEQSSVRGPGISLTTMQVYAALRTNPFPKTSFLFGITANRHRVGTSTETKYVKGTKIGGRLDLEHRFSNLVSGTLTYQAVEVGLDEIGTNVVSPSWLQLGVRFHF